VWTNPRGFEKDVFTSEQLAALIAAANSEDWTGAILCGYYAGLRLRDVADLQWNAINSEEQKITVTTRKTRKDVTIPIHPQFALWLQEQTQGIGKALVFPTLAGKSGTGESGLSMQFERLRNAPAFVAECYGKPTAKDVHNQPELSTVSGVVFISAMANAGVSENCARN
jgi:integrase